VTSFEKSHIWCFLIYLRNSAFQKPALTVSAGKMLAGTTSLVDIGLFAFA